MCANEIVREEDNKPHCTEKFLGGSKISYSTPHNREAHTHTKFESDYTRLLGTTPSHPHTHTVDHLNTRLYTHTRLLGTTPSLPHTHTYRNMFRLQRKMICSVQHEQTWEKSRLSRKRKDAQTSYKTFLLSNLPKNRVSEKLLLNSRKLCCSFLAHSISLSFSGLLFLPRE